MSGERLTPEQKIVARGAVAEVQEAMGFVHIAQRTREGVNDQLPLMQSAFAAVEQVLAASRPVAQPGLEQPGLADAEGRN